MDLASSTEIGSLLSATDLARAINDFNRASFDLATRRGARIVKTIGDEVMFVALDAAAVRARRASISSQYFSRHEVFTAARAGIATGDVLEQDGDCYGPVVNRAARFVAAAPDGSVTADAETVAAIGAGFAAVELAAVEHRGLGTVPWYRLSDRSWRRAGDRAGGRAGSRARAARRTPPGWRSRSGSPRSRCRRRPRPARRARCRGPPP